MDSALIALAVWVIKIVRAYLFAGLVFAIPFLLFGIQRVDPDAEGRNLGFRLLLIPGLCAFWPVFALRWVRGKRKPSEITAHRRAAAPTSAL